MIEQLTPSLFNERGREKGREGEMDGGRKDPRTGEIGGEGFLAPMLGKRCRFAQGPKFSQSRGFFRKTQRTGRKKGGQPP